MKLIEYFLLTRLSRTEFARQLDISTAHLSQLINGKREPSKNLAKKISELTKGYVSIQELLFPAEYPDITLDELNEMKRNKEAQKKISPSTSHLET